MYIEKIKPKISKRFRKRIINKNRKKLKNYDFSILSSNCNGCIITHELGIRFNTPTVNLFFNAEDFLKFISNLNYYINLELEDMKFEKFPRGKLGDLTINFLHYKSFEEAKKKWDERKKRINFNNLFIMTTDRDGCTYEMIKQFDELPYKNKVIFTHKYYPEFKSAYYIKGFENEKEVCKLSDYKNFIGNKYFDDFDYVEWLNNNSQ